MIEDMTDALMPHGLSCLSKPRTEFPLSMKDFRTTAWPPRRFQYVQSPHGENVTELSGRNDEDEERKKLPRIHGLTSLPYRRSNDDDREKDKQSTEYAVDNEEVPIIFYSPKADMIRRDTTGALEPRAGVWQEIAPWWDRVQFRFNQCRPYEVERRAALPQCSVERPGQVQKKPDIAVQYKPVIDPLTKKEVSFYKPVPGYGGYVPRYPVLPRRQEICPNPGLISISKTTYKLFPSYEYKKQKFAHTGPLSSAVTTTPPFNPYNKIDRLSLNGNKLLWKRPTQPNGKNVRR